MSVVVGLVKDGKVYMAADTRTTAGDEYFNHAKLFVRQHSQWGTWILAHAGDTRDTDLALKIDLPRRRRGKKFDESVLRDYFDKLQLATKSCGSVADTNGAESMWLVAVQGQLYRCWGNYTVDQDRDRPYMCFGSGAQYAKGCLWSLLRHRKDLDPELMVKEAVRSAMAHCESVGGSVNVAVI